MTSSLVGSEMCIRDRVTTGHAHRGVSSSPSPGTYNLHLEPGAVTPKPVSYTHLTLPTSVDLGGR
eukprot:5497084-Prorocentrum_lima.AAC.1